MENGVLCVLDLLYDAGEEPGSINVRVLHPNKEAKLPILVEEKTGRNPVVYLQNIIEVLCSEMLDRVRIDLKKDVILYLIGNKKLKDDYGTRYVKVFYSADKLCLEGVDDIE